MVFDKMNRAQKNKWNLEKIFYYGLFWIGQFALVLGSAMFGLWVCYVTKFNNILLTILSIEPGAFFLYWYREAFFEIIFPSLERKHTNKNSNKTH